MAAFLTLMLGLPSRALAVVIGMHSSRQTCLDERLMLAPHASSAKRYRDERRSRNFRAGVAVESGRMSSVGGPSCTPPVVAETLSDVESGAAESDWLRKYVSSIAGLMDAYNSDFETFVSTTKDAPPLSGFRNRDVFPIPFVGVDFVEEMLKSCSLVVPSGVDTTMVRDVANGSIRGLNLLCGFNTPAEARGHCAPRRMAQRTCILKSLQMLSPLRGGTPPPEGRRQP